MNEKIMTYANAAQDIGRELVHKGVALYENRDAVKEKAIKAVQSEKDMLTSLDPFDFAVFKLAILSLGISIGAYFSKKFKKLIPILCAFSAVASIYLIIRMLLPDED